MTTCPETILSIKNLSRTVTVDGMPKALIKNVSFDFCLGQIFMIVGPSGAGKSSLLRLINRLDDADNGSGIFFHDQETSSINPCELRTKIGYLFQTPHMFEGTVRDNILYADPAADNERINHLANHTHIPAKLINSPVKNLSIGERQRVALARMLATRPELMLLDEPTSALDPTFTEAIEQTIKEIVHKGGLSAIMVTHNPEQALRMGGTTLLMVEGELVESGPTEQVINNPQTELGQAYHERRLK